jgi:hypothetical protein
VQVCIGDPTVVQRTIGQIQTTEITKIVKRLRALRVLGGESDLARSPAAAMAVRPELIS